MCLLVLMLPRVVSLLVLQRVSSLHRGLGHTHQNDVKCEKRDEVVEAQSVSEQLSDQFANFLSNPLHKGPNMCDSHAPARNTDYYLNFQCCWGSQRSRMLSNHSPAVMKATAEVVQNAFETARRERVKAQ